MGGGGGGGRPLVPRAERIKRSRGETQKGGVVGSRSGRHFDHAWTGRRHACGGQSVPQAPQGGSSPRTP
eukprot:6856353-Alexandrium_andersonii.AAC.1